MDELNYSKKINELSKNDMGICDTVFAWLSVIFGIIIAKAMPVWQNTLGAFMCTFGAFAFSFIFLKCSGFKLKGRAILLFVSSLVISLGFITNGNSVIHTLLFLFEIALLFYWVYYSVGLAGKKLVGENIIFHLVNSMFATPVMSFNCFFREIIIHDKKGVGKKAGNIFLWVLLGLFCAIIPTTIVIALLSYDDGFLGLLSDIVISVSPTPKSVMDLILGLVIAILLFNSLCGPKNKSMDNGGNEARINKIKTDVLPEALLCSGVTPILIIYVIFFISQWDYYMSAFTGYLPEGITYANYAREGFFQLCIIAVINALMLLFFNVFMKRGGKISNCLRKIYSVIISIFTLILIATALSKMIMYIDSYGLTEKRVYTSWFMIFLGLIFILVIARLFFKRIPIAPVAIILLAVMFSVIALLNVDSFIADYNVNSYINGELTTVDIDTIAELDESGVPALLNLEKHLENKEELTENEKNMLSKIKEELKVIKALIENDYDGFFSYNIPLSRAIRLLEDR